MFYLNKSQVHHNMHEMLYPGVVICAFFSLAGKCAQLIDSYLCLSHLFYIVINIYIYHSE